MMTQTFTAVIHQEDDIYVALCPEIGTVSQGDTIETALDNLKEATELYLEEFPQTQHTKPLMMTFEAQTHA
jgi:predicted RNase H-like HicB family nuclease